jgi:hypothetical protein
VSYEVWIFDASQEPARLISISDAPPLYNRTESERWADMLRAEYEKEGLPVSTVVREESSY